MAARESDSDGSVLGSQHSSEDDIPAGNQEQQQRKEEKRARTRAAKKRDSAATVPNPASSDATEGGATPQQPPPDPFAAATQPPPQQGGSGSGGKTRGTEAKGSRDNPDPPSRRGLSTRQTDRAEDPSPPRQVSKKTAPVPPKVAPVKQVRERESFAAGLRAGLAKQHDQTVVENPRRSKRARIADGAGNPEALSPIRREFEEESTDSGDEVEEMEVTVTNPTPQLPMGEIVSALQTLNDSIQSLNGNLQATSPGGAGNPGRALEPEEPIIAPRRAQEPIILPA